MERFYYKKIVALLKVLLFLVSLTSVHTYHFYPVFIITTVKLC